MKLYEIANEYQQAFDAMTDEGLSQEIIADSLSLLNASFEEKAKAVAAHIYNLQAEAEQVKEAEVRMSTRYDKMSDKINALKKYLLTNMKVCDIVKISTPQFSVSIRKNPCKIVIDDEKLIPSDYKIDKFETFIVKDNIKAAIKEGKQVPGAHLEQSQRLHFE